MKYPLMLKLSVVTGKRVIREKTKIQKLTIEPIPQAHTANFAEVARSNIPRSGIIELENTWGAAGCRLQPRSDTTIASAIGYSQVP